MNQIDQYREQLSALKDRSDDFYKNMEAVDWSNRQRLFDNWFVQAMEQVLPYLESLPKVETSERCEIYARKLDAIRNIILPEDVNN